MRPDRIGALALRVGTALLFVLPLWWVLVLSLAPVGGNPSLRLPWWPAAPAFENYPKLFHLVPLARQAANSLFVAAVAVPLTLLTASLAGYSVARMGERWRRRFVIGLVLAMTIPVTALWLTRFVIFRQLGLIDSPLALIAPAIAGTNPLYILLFYRAFRRMPRETFDAARIDGAGHLSTWWRLALPEARPALVTAGVLAFVFYWSDLISPILYLKSEGRYTLPVGLSSLAAMDVTDGPLLMAGIVVITAPVILAFLFAQRFFWPHGGR
ncbi:MAG TPA: carbohydrate ABC transporter permease [Candidatus Eisenbacteria bacterium]